MKVGVMARKSTIPKKLKMYLKGFGEVMILRIYSIKNKMVNTHSIVLN
jgi:hypothetical protein